MYRFLEIEWLVLMEPINLAFERRKYTSLS